LKKYLKTNKKPPHIRHGYAQNLTTGQVPFMFRQKALISVTGHTLRPGGLTLTQQAVDFCGFNKKDLVLDAGCGYGMTPRFLHEEYGIKAMGTDAAPDMMAQARVKIPERLVQSRIPELPFRPGTFNGIFCECVLSLVQEKEACLKEFFRLLAQNGKLVLTDLYIPHRFKPLSRGCEKPGSCLEGAVTILKLIHIVEAAGFKIELMEDHTKLLKQLAGQMVFEHGSLRNFQDRLSRTICNKQIIDACQAKNLKPGYCMMVAGKYE